jgi:hypothetical protein
VAASAGHLHILQWLRSQHPPCPWDARSIIAAASAGHLHIFHWLRAQDPPCPIDTAASACYSRSDLCYRNTDLPHSHASMNMNTPISNLSLHF